MTRLNKYLADCGVASRRACDELIASGRVCVNGRIVKKLGTRVTNDDGVTLDGRLVQPQKKKVYVLLNKPVGYITSLKDERGRKTVLDIVNLPERVFPVGRLDYDSEGLLILTNDGPLAHQLTHPKFQVSKTYKVTLGKKIDTVSLKQLAEGIVLEDGPTLPCKIDYWGRSKSVVKVVLREGRNRQIKRMFAALGFKISRLKRTQFGPCDLKGLRRGEWRFLTEDEVIHLKQIINN